MAECRRPDFPRVSGVLAGQAGRPIPALPHQSLCSTPQRKCQVWPVEGAHRSQDKEIFRLSPSPPPLPPPPTHHNDRCALPVQENAGKCIGEVVVTEQRRDSTNVSVFPSRGVSRPGSWEPGTVLKNSAFAGLAARQRGAAFDAGWGLWVGGLTLTGRHWKELPTPTVKCQCMAAVRWQPQLLHWTPGDTDISSMTLTPDQYDSDPNADTI